MSDPPRYQARLCSSATCRLRFPVDAGSPLGAACPLCQAPTQLCEPTWATPPAPAPSDVLGPQISVLVDNVRSLRNVGAIFRTADGVGIAHVHLCGVSPTPAHPKLAKTALGAEQVIPWTRHMDATTAVAALREGGEQVWALEGGETSEDLFEVAPSLDVDARVTLVLGHEVSGVDVRVLDACQRRVFVPMAGIKSSLNVSTAFGVAAYALRYRLGRCG